MLRATQIDIDEIYRQWFMRMVSASKQAERHFREAEIVLGVNKILNWFERRAHKWETQKRNAILRQLQKLRYEFGEAQILVDSACWKEMTEAFFFVDPDGRDRR
ncbi:hypothetical protein KEM52_000101, partial [Ascosphaera acerosa]